MASGDSDMMAGASVEPQRRIEVLAESRPKADAQLLP